MSEIHIKKNPNAKRLNDLGVSTWPIWTKEKSEFPWTYDSQETCFFLEGKVIVSPKGGKPVEIGKGDLVIFPSGMSCTWKVIQDVRKHYKFEDCQ